MNILAIDTSSHACSVALLRNQEMKLRHEMMPMQHAKFILSFIEEVVGSPGDPVDVLAWGCGPGSFTGLRIAASIIQSMGYVWQLPVVNISSLAAVAQVAHEKHGWQEIAVAVDARMKEVYWGYYRANSHGFVELVGQEGRGLPEVLPFTEKIDDNYYAVGDGWSLYTHEIVTGLQKKPVDIDSNCLPSAAAVACLAQVKYKKGDWLQPFDALPQYLRDNVTT